VEEPVEEKTTVAPSLHQSEGEAQVSVEIPSGLAANSAKAPDGGSSWRAVGLLFNKTWLLNTLRLCQIFSVRCILPAVLLTSSGLCMTVGFFFSTSQIHPENTQFTSILAAMGMLFATMVLFLVFWIWGLLTLLVRLSIFSHVFYALDMTSKLPAAAEIQAIIASSHEFVSSRKKYFAQFYMVLSLVLIPPVLVAMVLFTVKSLTMTPPNSGAMPLKILLPPAVDVALTLVLAITSAYIAGVSFCAVAVSSGSREDANLAAWDCIKLSFRMFFPMMAIVVIIAVVNTVVATPQFCLHPMEYLSFANTTTTLPSTICSELWSGITSVILFTLSLAPFCELLRYRLK
jgi:hypothetical protein